MVYRFSALPLFLAASVEAAGISGQINLEQRQFLHPGLEGQDKSQTSVVIEPEWYTEWQDGDARLTIQPFYRWDSMDDERTHFDLREFMYLQLIDDYELRMGVGKVFWGVTESIHLVDVINQTDNVESVDGEQKLGQPMINVAAVKDWGTVNAFILPYFRERTFAGKDGRLRPPLPVNDDALYESSAEQEHIDWSLRYSHYFGDWDIGASFFQGTNRDPYFLPGRTSLTPYYAQMDQTSVDVQGIFGSWLLKLEALYRDSLENHSAVVTGFEYTLVGVFDTYWDLGLIAEYQYDSRSLSLNQNDLFLGTRFALNDIDGTEILFGINQDLDSRQESTGKIEASARINNNWKWRANAWWFTASQPDSPLYFVRKDDFVELALEYYF
ncbi:hypothetical protein [Photobacterium halotolerans]|uniref:hypothetical protein n=1 Tax=Photobacterium halotolerans TaxID=265726 RepID=UPI0003F5EA9C|nr:hypothetical protein [Photobacterium halotolerans]